MGTAKILMGKFLTLLNWEEVSFLAWNLVSLLLIALVALGLRSKGIIELLRYLTSVSPLFLNPEITVFLLEILIRVRTLAIFLLKAFY